MEGNGLSVLGGCECGMGVEAQTLGVDVGRLEQLGGPGAVIGVVSPASARTLT